MEEDYTIDNIEIHKKDNFVIISVNPKLYPLEVIYSSAYVFIDRAYIMIDGDPKEEILIQLRPKSDPDIEKLGREFNNELLNYMVYMYRTMRNQGIRETIMQRALATNAQVITPESTQPLQQEIRLVQDPEKIAKPWKPKDENK